MKKKSFPNFTHKEWITYFWNKFGGKKNDGRNYSEKKKLKYLLIMSNVIINYKWCKSLKKKRDNFNKIKHKRHQFRSHKRCFVCQNNGEVRHHIILLNNGGINSKRNVVTLCKKCHAKIHPWLSG